MFIKAYMPYGGYYSSPFCKWQGNLANENPITLGANTAKRWFAHTGLDPLIIDYLFYGFTVPANRQFYAHTWAAGVITAVR